MREKAYKVYFELQRKVTEERGNVKLARSTKNELLKMEAECNIRAHQYAMNLLIKEFSLTFND